MAGNFTLDTDAEGIATITWDTSGRSMNIIDMAAIQELSELVEKTASDEKVKGVVITSGKDTFCAGADLTLLNTMRATFAEFVKSQGEEAAAKKLFETYGVHFDAKLRDEVVARVDKLNMPSYSGFVQPRLEAVKGPDGRITDVKISYPLDLTAQMLEYSGRRK